ncbi:unnamed protein product [Fusarium equiseti]|uniref:Epoxide hydrolase N-terminal domain-containing protein n=1 Tax=Fusarium equiseti TaxID=61235 RepID=A0A8J2IM44_FUSEQ|nr:unnamed protein product [Fusarium equiseti]
MPEHDFSSLPYMVDESTNVKCHDINVLPSEIERLHLLLDNCPIVDETWENLNRDGHFGINREWLVGAVKEWRHNYDWKKWENRFNSLPHYTIDVQDTESDTYTLHFNALFSKRKDAHPMVQQKYSPDTLPYHIIVPDLVGFGFSSRPPLNKGFNIVDNGGDIGGFLGPRVAGLDPKTCRLGHVNMLTIQTPEGTNVEDDIKAGKYTQPEIESLEREKKVRIGEKLLEWSDPATRPSLELILTNVSFYWFSRCFPMSPWHYRSMDSGVSGIGSQLDGVTCPVGYS